MLKLKSFAVSDPSVIGPILANLVMTNVGVLANDFPSVVAQYMGPRPDMRVHEIGADIELANGRFDALTVCEGDVILGVATYAQRAMWLRPYGGLLPKRINGPLIAGWLDKNRPQSLQRISVSVLRLLAGEITAQPRLSGLPWTVIRPDNTPAIRAVEAVDNGFGGFPRLGEPRDYSSVDGVTAKRLLYVSDYDVRSLAATPGR